MLRTANPRGIGCVLGKSISLAAVGPMVTCMLSPIRIRFYGTLDRIRKAFKPKSGARMQPFLLVHADLLDIYRSSNIPDFSENLIASHIYRYGGLLFLLTSLRFVRSSYSHALQIYYSIY